jgi:translation initiation factor IF-1
MPREDAFKVEGLVVDVLSNGTYRVKLVNGHQLRAFVTGKARLNMTRFALGQKVLLEVSPYDLSEGRIIVEESQDKGDLLERS